MMGFQARQPGPLHIRALVVDEPGISRGNFYLASNFVKLLGSGFLVPNS